MVDMMKPWRLNIQATEEVRLKFAKYPSGYMKSLVLPLIDALFEEAELNPKIINDTLRNSIDIISRETYHDMVKAASYGARLRDELLKIYAANEDSLDICLWINKDGYVYAKKGDPTDDEVDLPDTIHRITKRRKDKISPSDDRAEKTINRTEPTETTCKGENSTCKTDNIEQENRFGETPAKDANNESGTAGSICISAEGKDRLIKALHDYRQLLESELQSDMREAEWNSRMDTLIQAELVVGVED